MWSARTPSGPSPRPGRSHRASPSHRVHEWQGVTAPLPLVTLTVHDGRLSWPDVTAPLPPVPLPAVTPTAADGRLSWPDVTARCRW